MAASLPCHPVPRVHRLLLILRLYLIPLLLVFPILLLLLLIILLFLILLSLLLLHHRLPSATGLLRRATRCLRRAPPPEVSARNSPAAGEEQQQGTGRQEQQGTGSDIGRRQTMETRTLRMHERLLGSAYIRVCVCNGDDVHRATLHICFTNPDSSSQLP
eukprot:GHVU01052547.1.p2 GENE.GHVU01052547.1~~GHVU01052547.1.p2  ORF type:complete len:160 (-),score=23.51 GHVU01052547.1:522-1001(-)